MAPKPAEAIEPHGLRVRLFGEMAIVRGGATVALPASKKTRALLGYLVATPTNQSRQRLCDLFWDGPDDPRAALRWSLTKLRPLVDDENAVRIVADRERVGFEPLGARVDLLDATAYAGSSVAATDAAALRRAATALAGDFLEGLELPDCYRFHEWCTAERERFRTLRLSILDALVERIADTAPEEALAHARLRLSVDPLSDVAHSTVVRLLARLGRNAEAQAQVDTCRRILERELGGRRSPALDIARTEIGKAAAAPPPVARSAPEPVARPASEPVARSVPEPVARQPSKLVARAVERNALEELFRQAHEGQANDVVLVTGEPGMGKSRLLQELAAFARANNGQILGGRAFEAEAVRPFGIWIDLLRGLSLATLDADLRQHLAPLFPELGDTTRDTESKSRLFDGIARLLRDLSAHAPLILVVDDLHWLDEASSGLLHYVSRVSAGSHIGIACAARDGELDDNPGALRFVRALRREARLRHLSLKPLDEADTRTLVQSAVGESVDAERVFRDSAGNPLFVLELARALASGTREGSQAIEDLLEERLSRLEPRARDLVVWAAALGREFDAEILAAVTGESLSHTVGAIGELEHHGLVIASGTRHAFAHELARKAAYRQLSGPRQRLVHLSIARALAATSTADGWGDVVHHATLADDPMLVATACVAAGERALKMMARRSARDFASRGLAHAARLGLGGLTLRAKLLEIAGLSAASDPQRQTAFEEDAEEVVRLARENGRPEIAATALFALGYLRNARGDLAGAHEATLGQAEAARSTSPAESIPTIANTAMCLAIIERELPRARALLDEVADMARAHKLAVIDIELGEGYLAHVEGDLAHARGALGRALALARARNDVWRECMVLTRQSMIAIECADWDTARTHAEELGDVAKRLGGEGSEAVIADGLEALALRGAGDPTGASRLAKAIEALAVADAKAMLAFVVTQAAEMAIEEGAVEMAQRLGSRALVAAESIGKPSALILAHVTLGRCALKSGDGDAARIHLAAARDGLEHPFGVSMRARDAVSAFAALSNAHPNAGVHAQALRRSAGRKKR
jgi:DNA-binding SARP family transcriptional activator/tetratricopeptide (TPR) repeat protein